MCRIHDCAIWIRYADRVSSDTFVDDVSTDSTEVRGAAAVGDGGKIWRDDSGRGGTYACGGRKTNVMRSGIVRNVYRSTTTRNCINMYGSRLPSPSVGGRGRRRAELARASGGNGVVAALHAKCGGIILVSFGFVQARDGRVVAMWAEPMSPTIIHFTAFDRDVLRGSSSGKGRVGC